MSMIPEAIPSCEEEETPRRVVPEFVRTRRNGHPPRIPSLAEMLFALQVPGEPFSKYRQAAKDIETRKQAILAYGTDHGDFTARDLEAMLKVSRTTVAGALRQLASASLIVEVGLVKPGNQRLFRVLPPISQKSSPNEGAEETR